MLIIIIVRINKSLFYCNKLSKTNILLWEGGACIRQGVFVREECRKRGIY